MERRDFVQLSLLTSLVTLKNNPFPGGDDKNAFVVRSGEDRYQEELHVMGGQFDCKLSSKDTNGSLLIYDTVRQAKGGPPLHVHHKQDELFYVIRGEFTVKVGEDSYMLKAGDFAFAPRRIPHTFAKTNEGEGQLMISYQPAGSMEDFFLQMSKIGKDIPKDQEKTLKDLYRAHGCEIVGPPLKF